MEDNEVSQYFLEHPDQYSAVQDDEVIRFLKSLQTQALTEDEIFFLYKKNAKRIFQKCLDLNFIEKVMVAGKQRFFVTAEGKIFLQEWEKLRKSFEMFR
ncbi:MAG: hypothetical protein Q7R70_00545 [Candidatus Diapherotrites archaeon]|nr:hypothetical protein [Candidatus Diapherotrites archaeon]